MTIEYWYHYGAVILWPKNKHFDILKKSHVDVRLEWLEYYIQHWEDKGFLASQKVKDLLGLFPDEEMAGKQYWSTDFSPIAMALLKLDDEELVQQKYIGLLASVFSLIDVQHWIALLQHYTPGIFNLTFQKAAQTDQVVIIDHLLNILHELNSIGSQKLSPFILEQIQLIADHLSKLELSRLGRSYEDRHSNRKKTISAIIEKILFFSQFKNNDSLWTKNILARITNVLSRKYVNEVLSPVLLKQKKNKTLLTKSLLTTCIDDLIKRTKEEPAPPKDWKREVPSVTSRQEIWNKLAPFLNSPTEKVFEYRANQRYRTEMEYAVKSVTIDLKMETIKRGSPHTLRLTKTTGAHKRTHKKWKEDILLLEQLKKI